MLWNFIVLRSVPSPPKLISTTSPSLRNVLGSMKSPTPDGVPVIISVPFLSVVPCDANEMSCRTVQIMSAVVDACRRSPLTLVSSVRSWGSGTTRGEAMTGPMGANPSKDLQNENWPPETLAGI
ncbi:hypothetical protein CRV24_003710 [Beauveria bassiana]|nr:hypothetical protein CRV24_003710 [Beauveria bassiana]